MADNSRSQDPSGCQKVFDDVQHFLDVPLIIRAQLGSCNMKIREILELKRDSIVELPKSAGENIDIFINDKLVAYGEVLEMEGNAGIRLTDLHTPS
jgi:flagellar motor switch protein FliN